MKVPPEFVDENYRLKYDLFMDDDGILKPEFASKYGEGVTEQELKDNRGLAAMVLGKALLALLPYSIPFGMKDKFDLEAISEWMRGNVHDAWQLSMRDGNACFIFARDVDAINFKMAWT